MNHDKYDSNDDKYEFVYLKLFLGREKLSALPVGGAAPVPVVATPGAAAAPAEEKKGMILHL